jgi:AraC-like DNA-binding protein
MELLNKEEHLNCYLYANNNNPLIEYFTKSKGETFETSGAHSQIIFLLTGKLVFSCGSQVNKVFDKGTFLLFPHGYKCTISAEEYSSIVIVNMHGRINFCNHFPLEMLYKMNKTAKHSNSDYPLQINEVVDEYLNLLVKSFNDGLKCAYFHDIKQRELLFYLRAYYPKKDLFAFFAPILNSDITFSELIYKNFDKIKNISELATITNYSISGFKKRFIKVFGIPPYSWMAKEKAKRVYHEINCSQKSFKEISVEFDFSSPAHFDKFCKKSFGMSPGTIRDSNVKNVLIEKSK